MTRRSWAWRLAAVAAAGALALGLVACGDDDDTSSDGGGAADEGTDGGELPGEGMRIGLVYDIGGRGDQSFNDSAFAGLSQAEEELGVEIQDLEPAAGGENREELLRTLADEGYDMVVGVGFAWCQTRFRLMPKPRFEAKPRRVAAPKEKEKAR